MNNELISINDSFSGFEVTFTQGKVEIAGYNEIYAALSELADYLKQLEVNEDNIKENKKLVARVSKATKGLIIKDVILNRLAFMNNRLKI